MASGPTTQGIAVNGSVTVTLTRLSAHRLVVVHWGDGSATSVRGTCTAKQAKASPSTCATSVQHQYGIAGAYKLRVRSPHRVVLLRSRIVVGGGAAADTLALPTDWQQSMLDAVNDLRSKAGVHPLALCNRLDDSAQGYAQLMLDRNYFGHTGPDGTQPWDRMSAAGYQWKGAAENIAAGQRGVAAVMAAWQNSPGHLENMLNPSFRHIGFGYAFGGNGTYRTYWVQNFGYGGSCG